MRSLACSSRSSRRTRTWAPRCPRTSRSRASGTRSSSRRGLCGFWGGGGREGGRGERGARAHARVFSSSLAPALFPLASNLIFFEKAMMAFFVFFPFHVSVSACKRVSRFLRDGEERFRAVAETEPVGELRGTERKSDAWRGPRRSKTASRDSDFSTSTHCFCAWRFVFSELVRAPSSCHAFTRRPEERQEAGRETQPNPPQPNQGRQQQWINSPRRARACSSARRSWPPGTGCARSARSRTATRR